MNQHDYLAGLRRKIDNKEPCTPPQMLEVASANKLAMMDLEMAHNRAAQNIQAEEQEAAREAARAQQRANAVQSSILHPGDMPMPAMPRMVPRRR